MKEDTFNIDNKVIHLVKTNKFKSNTIFINLSTKYSKKDYTYLLFLQKILLYSTKEYPSYRDLAIECEELYNASINAGFNVFKDFNTLSFRISSLNDKYSEEGNTEGLFSLLHEIIFNPLVENNSFNKDTFNVVRDLLINNINRFNEDKENYARVRMLEEYNYNSPLANRDCGDYDVLMEITPSNLYEYYKKLLDNSMIDIFVVGDIDSKEVTRLVKKHIPIKGQVVSFKTNYKEEPSDYNEIIEEDDINQSKLVLGVSLNEEDDFHKSYSFNLYSIILGGTPDSKFFRNIREKHSACYYASARAMRANNLMVIRSGIDFKNYKKVIDLMKKEMDDMKSGLFTEDDINVAKSYIKSSIESKDDDPNQIILGLITYNYYGISSDEEYISNIEKVTKEDIIKVANEVSINTIYLLKEVTNEN